MSTDRGNGMFGTPIDRRQVLRRFTFGAVFTIGSGGLLAACQSTSTPTSSSTASGAQATGTAPSAATSQPSQSTTSSPTSISVKTPTAGAASAPKTGGSLRIPVNANVNPWPPIGGLQNLMVNKALFNGLVRYSAADWSPEPDLAEKWDISNDKLTWTFSLKKGVTWHDGTPFTADDVKWSLEMYADEKVNSILRGNLAPIAGVEIVDPQTVKVSTKQPYSSLVELLGYLTFMLPKHLLEGKEFNRSTFPQDFIQHPIGTGPFKFGEHSVGDHFTVVANENYHEGRPYLDSVIYRVVRDLNSTVSQVKTGELDIAFPTIAQLPALEGASNLRLAEQGLMDYRFFSGYQKNPKFGPWFSQKTVRQAMAHAIDANGIIQQVAKGKADRSNGPLPPALKKWYIPDLPTFDYNPDTAKKMLMDIGFKSGSDNILEKDGQKFSFTFYTDQGQPERDQTALIVQQNFKDIGIDAKLQTIEFTDLLQRYRVSHDFEALAFYYVTPPTPDLHSYWQTNGSTNEWGYSNTEVDQLFLDGLSAFDYDQRRQVYKKLYTIIAEDQAVNFIYHPHEVQAINKKVQGWADTDFRDALLYLNKVWIEQ